MSGVDARLSVHHPCPYCDISVEFPRTTLLLWCDNRRDIFAIVSPGPQELDRVLQALRASFHARVILREAREALAVVPDFEWGDPPSVTGLARRAGVWVVHPVLYHQGQETYRLLAPTRSALNRFVHRIRRLGAVEILSVTDRRGSSSIGEWAAASVHVFEGLTERQLRSLVAAYEGGLLDVPSRGSWTEVARREGVSRSTFGEHLRKGQWRLVANSYSLLKSRAAPPETPEVLPAIRSSRRIRRTPQQGIRPG